MKTVLGYETLREFFGLPEQDGSMRNIWGASEARWAIKHWTGIERLEGFSLLEGDEEVETILEERVSEIRLRCIKRVDH